MRAVTFKRELSLQTYSGRNTILFHAGLEDLQNGKSFIVV